MPVVALPNLRMSYQLAGTGEAVVLLHGLGSSSRDWEDQIPVLATRYCVIAPDLRGHGQSEKLATRSIEEMADDVAQLLDRLGTGPVHLVGISMGGMVALQLAIDHPQLLSSLVIVNSGPDAVPRTVRVRLLIALRFAVLRLFGMRRLSKLVAGKLFPDPSQEAMRRRFIERASANDPVAYKAAMRAIVRWCVADQLSAIRVKTLVITGDQDYTPVALKAEYVEKLPDARLVVIPNSRHATPIDQAAVFNATVLEFLGGVRRDPGVAASPRLA
jgi:3-oxoadipate enol-lactonase